MPMTESNSSATTNEPGAAQWRVQLVGSSWDREAYEDAFPTGEAYIIREGKSHLMTGPAFAVCCDGFEVHDVAHQHLTRFTGIIRIQWTGIEQVRLGDVTKRHADGRIENDTSLRGALEWGVRVRPVRLSLGNDAGPVTPTKAQRIEAAAAQYAHLATALELWAQSTPTWPQLYKLVEELQEYARTCGIVEGRLWSVNQLKLFKWTANSPAAGNESRHHLGHAPAPDKPMSRMDAILMVASALQTVTADL